MCFSRVADDFLESDGNVNCTKYLEISSKGKKTMFCKAYSSAWPRYCDFQQILYISNLYFVTCVWYQYSRSADGLFVLYLVVIKTCFELK